MHLNEVEFDKYPLVWENLLESYPFLKNGMVPDDSLGLLEEFLAEKLITIHQEGKHWWVEIEHVYAQRKRYTVATTQKDLEDIAHKKSLRTGRDIKAPSVREYTIWRGISELEKILQA